MISYIALIKKETMPLCLALSQVTYVNLPALTYKLICTGIFLWDTYCLQLKIYFNRIINIFLVIQYFIYTVPCFLIRQLFSTKFQHWTIGWFHRRMFTLGQLKAQKNSSKFVFGENLETFTTSNLDVDNSRF